MRKVIYIEPFEEVTGIVNKIKSQQSKDIFLVIPEDAVLVKGLINLEILKREARKQEKEITFVTSDPHIKRVLQDLNLKVSEDSNLIEEADDNMKPEQEDKILDKAIEESIQRIEETSRPKDSIGTNEYYSQENFIETGDDVKDQKNLNFKKTKKKRIKKEDFNKKFRLKSKFKEKEAENFFNNPDGDDFLEKNNGEDSKFSPKTRRSFKFILGAISFLIILIGVSGWIYLNWPKVEVDIYPRSETINKDIEFKVVYGDENQKLEEGAILGELKEFEVTKEYKFSASGEKYSSDKGKARGKIKIVNNYSSSEQPLVATTRFLSKDGKLFRLVNGIIVPGMEDGKPGEIEATVVADKPGADYNIDSSSFTIEGFKGNLKYEKFQVISDEKMTGGSDEVDNNKVKYITEDDIDKARKDSVDLFNKDLEKIVQSKVGADKKFLEESVGKEIIDSKPSLEAGEIGDNFEFIIKEKISVVVFDEIDLKNLIYLDILKEDLVGYELDSDSIKINYKNSSNNKEEQDLKVEMEFSSLIWPKIDIDNIKTGIEGKNEQEIKSVLERYSEIKKASIGFYPSWLKGLPITKEKIIINQIEE